MLLLMLVLQRVLVDFLEFLFHYAPSICHLPCFPDFPIIFSFYQLAHLSIQCIHCRYAMLIFLVFVLRFLSLGVLLCFCFVL